MRRCLVLRSCLLGGSLLPSCYTAFERATFCATHLRSALQQKGPSVRATVLMQLSRANATRHPSFASRND
eukprot:13007547-Heterocapsa_arctica.AAC.1